jgi:hypothetical protein
MLVAIDCQASTPRQSNASLFPQHARRAQSGRMCSKALPEACCLVVSPLCHVMRTGMATHRSQTTKRCVYCLGPSDLCSSSRLALPLRAACMQVRARNQSRHHRGQQEYNEVRIQEPRCTKPGHSGCLDALALTGRMHCRRQRPSVHYAAKSLTKQRGRIVLARAGVFQTEMPMRRCLSGCCCLSQVSVGNAAESTSRCRYQVCLFCLQKLQQEHGNRCPGCRTLYGTDREEWQRQADARAQEAQRQQLQNAQKRSQNTSFASLASTASARKASASISDRDKLPPTQLPGQGSPSPPSPRAGSTSLESQHWPNLDQAKSGSRQQADQGSLSRAGNSVANHCDPIASGPPKEPAHNHSGPPEASQDPEFVSVPVTVQSIVNGHSTRVDTVLELRPPSPHEQQHFVPMDGSLEHLVGQFQQLSAADRAMKASQQRRPTAAALAPPAPPTNPPSAAFPATRLVHASAAVPFPPPGIKTFASARPNMNGAAALAATARPELDPVVSVPNTSSSRSWVAAPAEFSTSVVETDSNTYNPLAGALLFGSALHESGFNIHANGPHAAAASTADHLTSNYVPQVFALPPMRSASRPWLTQNFAGAAALLDTSAPLASLLPASNANGTRRKALYERSNVDADVTDSSKGPHESGVAPLHVSSLSPMSEDPVISPRRLAAHAAPIGTGPCSHGAGTGPRH